jgi:hypothetical protein
MSDSSEPELDLREFCARVLREYEEVISTIIQRPIPRPIGDAGPGIGAVAVDGGLPAEPA